MNMRMQAYEQQEGICTHCNEHFELNQMEADHITPWSKGGSTEASNCQMLCNVIEGKVLNNARQRD